jgi:hypothetical protein
MHVSTVLRLHRKYRVLPKMFGVPVKNLTNRNCYLACLQQAASVWALSMAILVTCYKLRCCEAEWQSWAAYPTDGRTSITGMDKHGICYGSMQGMCGELLLEQDE